jgi:DNA-binding ferritin-like protein
MDNEQPPKDIAKNGVLLLTSFVAAQNQFRIYHWQTRSFSQHEAFGKTYESLSEHVDEFIEVFMGKYGRIIADTAFNFTLQNYSEAALVYADRFEEFLVDMVPAMLDPTDDTDLLNIRDEILAAVNKLQYLLTLS